MTTADGLVTLRDLLEDPFHWTQNASARDLNGRAVRIRSPKAARWCLLGGIAHVAQDDAGLSYSMRVAIVKAAAGLDPLKLNDNMSTVHQDIIDVIDRATEEVTNGRSCICSQG